MHIDVENQNQQQVPDQEQNGGQGKKVHPVKSSEAGSAKQKFNRASYQIDWKKFGFLIGSIILLLAIVGGVWWLIWGRDKSGGDDPVAVYDVAVMLKDQTSSDPEEDAKSSLKAGDVVLARETGREWSNTEKISYLILKMKLKQSQAAKLTEPETKELSEKEAIEKGLVDEERLREMKNGGKGEEGMQMSKVEIEQLLTETVRARKYRIKIEDLDFDPMKVRNAQPFPDQEFGWKIVEKK